MIGADVCTHEAAPTIRWAKRLDTRPNGRLSMWLVTAVETVILKNQMTREPTP